MTKSANNVTVLDHYRREPALRADGGPAIIGVHINDPEPLTEVLRANGVIDPEAWTLHTDCEDPYAPLPNNQLAIYIPLIRELADGHQERYGSDAVTSFKAAATSSILQKLVVGPDTVTARELKRKSVTKELQSYVGMAACGSVMVGLNASLMPESLRVPFLTVMGALGLSGLGYSLLPSERESRKIIRMTDQVAKDNPALVQALSEVVLPVFFETPTAKVAES